VRTSYRIWVPGVDCLPPASSKGENAMKKLLLVVLLLSAVIVALPATSHADNWCTGGTIDSSASCVAECSCEYGMCWDMAEGPSSKRACTADRRACNDDCYGFFGPV